MEYLTNHIQCKSYFSIIIHCPTFTVDSQYFTLAYLLACFIHCDYCDYLPILLSVPVVVCGSTGEGMSMSLEERKLVAEEWIKVSKMKKRSFCFVIPYFTFLNFLCCV